MQEAIQQTSTFAEASDPLAAAAYRAETWAGEPFLRDGEDPAIVLAPGTARRLAPRARGAPRGARAAHESGDGAAPAPGGRARRDAHGDDRGDATQGGERQ